MMHPAATDEHYYCHSEFHRCDGGGEGLARRYNPALLPEPYWTDGDITLYLGDCRTILPLLGPVDHCITDPPYARDVYRRMGSKSDPGEKMARFKGQANRRMAGSFALNNGVRLAALVAGEIGCIDEMLAAVALEITRLTRRWAIVFSDIETCHLWREGLEGMRYVRTGAWVKSDPMPQFSGDRPGTGFEPCTITHAQGAMRWNGGGHSAVWTYGTVKTDRPDHPCPKPLPLMRELVEQFTDPGETILDPFAGSSTTLLAAKQLGRKAIGIEMNEKYCALSVKRLTTGLRNAALIDAGQGVLL